jgi:uncharacterized membrane protein YphA (DoxX/SURF4 family)
MACGKYALVALRLVLAAFWLNVDIPRWVALAVGKPVANPLVHVIFGPNMAVPVTYFFTLLETLGAVALILGLLVRLASLWAVIQYATIDAFDVESSRPTIVLRRKIQKNQP